MFDYFPGGSACYAALTTGEGGSHRGIYFMLIPPGERVPAVSKKSKKNNSDIEELLREVAEMTSQHAVKALLFKIREMEANLLLEMNITT